MKKLTLTLAIIFTTLSLFASVVNNPIKGKKNNKKSPAAVTFCQVIEVKGMDNKAVLMAVYSESATDKSSIVVFADSKVIEQPVQITNIDAHTQQLQAKYAGIKIWGVAKK